MMTHMGHPSLLLSRPGLPPLWARAAIFPLFAVIHVWIVAFKNWPEDHA